MDYSEHFETIKLNVQAVKFDVDDTLKEKIRAMVSYLKKFSSNRIIYANLYLEDKQGKSTDQKSVKVVLGVPGPDIVASDRGDDFAALLMSVREKLIVQLKR